MDQDLIRSQIIERARRQGVSHEVAAREIARAYDLDVAKFQGALDAIRDQIRLNTIMESPDVMTSVQAQDDLRNHEWYPGPDESDVFWPRYQEKLIKGAMARVVPEIDRASTKVVSLLADPMVHGMKKRGMVVGYVQSGKTANYTAVIAKAADAGYRLIVVLAGMHNNLRRQTQVRLTKDLLDDDWVPLTTPEADFGRVVNGAAILNRGAHCVAVVKKNQARLRALRDWLRAIPEEVRRRAPILILDDEADQATPNSAAGVDEQTRINELLRQIWREVATGTYLGYTATPFANVFMDPTDEEELYPADFIVDLPRPEAYFGAERIFGREPMNAEDDPDPGLDVVRQVPDSDADLLKPPTDKEGRQFFDPGLPSSLEQAINWFVVATAIRHARGQDDAHSSMLIHTTHYVDPHFAMRDQVQSYLDECTAAWESGVNDGFERSYRSEGMRAAEVASQRLPSWHEVEAMIGDVLSGTRVVVDNGRSEDRLDYERVSSDGTAQVETVIAIGGGTLSRGLTLEGLVVSYFTRTSNTYDTLLQMGRWFGYRGGYEDLPRIWMQDSLADDFRFLALVEEEIRSDIRSMAQSNFTPRQAGVRVRSHPGRLAIVSRNKMRHADVVRVSYSGQRLQTFMFDLGARHLIQQNKNACLRLVQAAIADGRSAEKLTNSRWLMRRVPASEIARLIDEYSFHPDQTNMNREHMAGWIRRMAPDTQWNVVVAGSDRRQVQVDGQALDLGHVDLGLDRPVPAVNRSRLAKPDRRAANIKALLSHSDWFADFDQAVLDRLDAEQRKRPKELRRKHADGNGMVILYPISKNSVPLRENARKVREPLDAPEHLIGLGIIFPDVESFDATDGTYYSVHPDWEFDVEDEDLPADLELNHVVNAEGAS